MADTQALSENHAATAGLGSVQYAAVVERSVTALRQEARERGFKRLEIGDLPPDFGKARDCYGIHLGARSFHRSCRQGQEFAHGAKREAEFTSFPDENEPFEMPPIIDPMPAPVSAGFGEQPDFLVVADCDDLASGDGSQGPDGKILSHGLEPIAAIGLK